MGRRIKLKCAVSFLLFLITVLFTVPVLAEEENASFLVTEESLTEEPSGEPDEGMTEGLIEDEQADEGLTGAAELPPSVTELAEMMSGHAYVSDSEEIVYIEGGWIYKKGNSNSFACRYNPSDYTYDPEDGLCVSKSEWCFRIEGSAVTYVYYASDPDTIYSAYNTISPETLTAKMGELYKGYFNGKWTTLTKTQDTVTASSTVYNLNEWKIIEKEDYILQASYSRAGMIKYFKNSGNISKIQYETAAGVLWSVYPIDAGSLDENTDVTDLVCSKVYVSDTGETVYVDDKYLYCYSEERSILKSFKHNYCTYDPENGIYQYDAYCFKIENGQAVQFYFADAPDTVYYAHPRITSEELKSAISDRYVGVKDEDRYTLVRTQAGISVTREGMFVNTMTTAYDFDQWVLYEKDDCFVQTKFNAGQEITYIKAEGIINEIRKETPAKTEWDVISCSAFPHSGTCGENLTWKLEDTLLTISGTGPMADFAAEEAPWYNSRMEIDKIVIENGVTSIGAHAFEDSFFLKTVMFPDGLTEIGAYAFSGCEALQRVMNLRTIENVGMSVPDDEDSFEGVVISKSVKTIGIDAFLGCEYVFDVYFEGTELDGYLFDTKDELNDFWGPPGTTLHVPTSVDVSSLTPVSGGSLYYWSKYYNHIEYVVNDIVIRNDEDPEPVITEQPVSCKAIAGKRVKISVIAEGSDLTYQWQYLKPGKTNWANSGLASARTSTLSFTMSAGYDGMQYRCVVTDASGRSVTSDTVTSVLSVAPIIVEQPVSVKSALGITTKIAMSAEGTDLIYQWQYQRPGTTTWKNSGLSSATTPTLRFKMSEGYDGMKFRCKVKDADGNVVYTNVALVTLVDGPTITKQPEDVTKAIGTKATFSINASGNSLTYQWQFQKVGKTTWVNSTSAGNKTDTLKVSATTGTNGLKFRCVVTNAEGNVCISDYAVLIAE